MTVLTALSTASTVALGLVLAFRGAAGAALVAAAGFLLLAGVIALSVGISVPINRQIAQWSVEHPPSQWAAVRSRWAHLHACRTYGSVAAFGCSLAAVGMGA